MTFRDLLSGRQPAVRVAAALLALGARDILAQLPGDQVGPVDSGFIQVEGGRLFYEATGNGPVMVMIHDGLLHRATWDAQFHVFARDYRVVRWDRRGYGRSDRPTAPFAMVDDLQAVFRTLKISRAIVIGCSAGGLLAIDFALEHPDEVSALVLVGPVVSGLGASEHFLTRGGRGFPADDAQVPEKIAYWADRDPWIMAPESRAARNAVRALLAANPQDLEGSGPFARWPAEPALGRLGAIQVPTLIVTGEADIPDVHVHVGAIQAGIKGARRVVLPHAGHLVHREVPDEFNRIVLDFLKDVR